MPFMAKRGPLDRCDSRTGRKEKPTRGTRNQRHKRGEKEWPLPEDWDVNRLVVYGFAVSENGQNASGTLGLLETNGDA